MERKEAIEVVKKNYPHCAESGTQFETALRTLIPELQESEDAKIRKEIITFIVTTPKQRNSHSKWIAWLEKQGQQESVDSYCRRNCKGFQETGKCFADGGCKAKREAESTDNAERL